MDPLPITEGFIPFRGYRTWYRVVGGHDAQGTFPLLTLHGGPGAPHDYLEPLAALAETTGRRVIFYDQTGAGNSDHPHDPALWTVGLFVDELATLIQALGLEHVHLLGSSWGGMLAMEYALTQPRGLASLILSDTLASVPQWFREANRLRAELPADVQETLQRHEAAGTMESEEYQAALYVYFQRHYCRLDPWPECLLRTTAKGLQDGEVYRVMWGTSEFEPLGTLKTWDITGSLHKIRVPTLLLSGRYDMATPAIVETLQRGIPGSEWVLFERSAHVPHLEEPERFLAVVARFLAQAERADAGQRKRRKWWPFGR